MTIKRMDHMPQIEIECDKCHETFNAAVYSRSFTSDSEFLCIECGLLLFVSPYDRVYRYVMEHCGLHPLYSKAKEWVEGMRKYLLPCECGGGFGVHERKRDLYRCPHCGEKLDEDLTRKAMDKLDTDGTDYHHSYDNPGLETIGHLDRECNAQWRTDIDEPGYLEALRKDQEMAERVAESQRISNAIQENLKKGVPPEKILLRRGFDSGLYFMVDNCLHVIDPSQLNVPNDLIQKVKNWSCLGEYVENGCWGCEDLPPEEFKQVTWQEYYDRGKCVQEKLQTFLGSKTIVVLDVKEEGEPFDLLSDE